MSVVQPINPKDQMIAAAVALVRAKGPAATGFADIIEASGAPRGSIYHHFPKGKSELLTVMIERAGALVAAAIAAESAKAASPSDLVRRIARVFSKVPAEANWTLGCPVAATTVEGDHQPESVRAAITATFGLWVDAVAKGLADKGLTLAASQELARAVVAGLEGGLILARGQRDPRGYESMTEVLAFAADQRAVSDKP
ncbi:MAG: TetR/AcrR family transcriptional regulator [Alphaproteobacteria bacterium]